MRYFENAIRKRPDLCWHLNGGHNIQHKHTLPYTQKEPNRICVATLKAAQPKSMKVYYNYYLHSVWSTCTRASRRRAAAEKWKRTAFRYIVYIILEYKLYDVFSCARVRASPLLSECKREFLANLSNGESRKRRRKWRWRLRRWWFRLWCWCGGGSISFLRT